jgi:hypothetical protein
MKKTIKREPGKSLLFDLTEEGAKFRSKWRGPVIMLIWLGLSAIAMLTVFFAEFPIHKYILVGLSLAKYIPLLIVVYSLARQKAAKYLDDVYELDDDAAASAFLEEAAFGQAHHKVTIKNGKITEKDELSPLILIGGPGFIQVNLDNLALLEKATGEPEIIYPRKNTWRLGSFERLREIGDSDEVGRREYAIINLREQKYSIPSVRSRTKDGIPVEARGIKATFNVLRHKDEQRGEEFPFDEKAARTLVYKQTTVTPKQTNLSDAGFPWNTTIVPLIIAEIEQVISSHTSNEILASIGQKEIDNISTAEQTAAQMRVEITGKQPAYTGGGQVTTLVSKSISRATITERFYHPPFTDKAAALGVHLNWIDVGTWEPSAPIRDKIKSAWKTATENIQKHGLVEKWKKQHTDEEIHNLIDVVALSFSNKLSGGSGGDKGKEMTAREAQKLAAENPELLNNPRFMEKYTQVESVSKKSPLGIAQDMLKAFRKELLAGHALIEEKDKLEEKQADLGKIKKTLDAINIHLTPQKPV